MVQHPHRLGLVETLGKTNSADPAGNFRTAEPAQINKYRLWCNRQPWKFCALSSIICFTYGPRGTIEQVHVAILTEPRIVTPFQNASTISAISGYCRSLGFGATCH
jgi:hypothetical protein